MTELERDRAVRAASPRIETLHAELVKAYPALRGTMAIPGMFIGHGLAHFVSSGMSNDQILANVLLIVAEIRKTLEKPSELS
jgi:hypothetical protein